MLNRCLIIFVGNTNTKIAVSKADSSLNVKIFPSQNIDQICDAEFLHIDDEIYIAGVVPDLVQKLHGDFTRRGKVAHVVSSKDYDKFYVTDYVPKQALGIDRVFKLVEGVALNSAEICVLVDFGTAVTVDVLACPNRHLGGWILPGFQASLYALNRSTAQLPSLQWQDLPNVDPFALGNSTNECIACGIHHLMLEGVFHCLLGLLNQYDGKTGEVLVTGGGGSMFFSHVQDRLPVRFYESLVMEGMLKYVEKTLK